MIGRLASGVALAAGLALLVAVPRIAGVETWKWALGVAGLALFLIGGIPGRTGRPL